MKKLLLASLIFGYGLEMFAQTIDFSNGGTNSVTGDVLDEITEMGVTNNVVEIPGLNIAARAGGEDQKINTTGTSLGITVFGSGDDTDRFDPGESMTISFDKSVEITKIDFIGYASNSVFVVAITNQPDWNIGYNDLDNKTSQFITTNIVVDAETEIDFYVGNTNSVIGLQSMAVTVLGGNGMPMLTLEMSNGTAYVYAVFDGTAVTNHVLQSSTNLTSNVWTTVSSPFASDTNWNIGTETNAVYFRTISQ